MRELFLFFMGLFSVITLRGQDCTYNKLSKQYNFKIHVKSVPQGGETDSVFISVGIYSKEKKLLQQIKFGSDFFLLPFTDCTKYRSYTTGVNRDNQVMDWDYGDIIVADFNFDGAEDLAVKKEQGSNSGPRYNYYIKGNKGLFKKDTFLSDTMEYFPSEFIGHQKKLIGRVRANTYEYNETTYQYNNETKNWKVLKKVLKNYP